MVVGLFPDRAEAFWGKDYFFTYIFTTLRIGGVAVVPLLISVLFTIALVQWDSERPRRP
ncbi:hypothetical protein [Sphingomicrobium flavum]|uniref:hypothetical protein n=1 Tax=Sphingomicrobium flavum TaxID=1229164 RepID=UPI0021ADC658|nr:hypothetical protein [Sphingomicrobium flavum]